MSEVRLRNVVKAYGANQVIHGIDLTINSGEFVVFVGPSGCGKSTLLRMIAGLEDITSGEIDIGGTIVNELPPRARDIAMVFQDYALYPHKTVFENMAFGLRLRKRPEEEIKARVTEAADILQITHLFERKPRELSGGQRQRVAMGRSIVRQPKAFLFDEPLSNLDALLRAEMRIEIKKLHQKLGNTIIYVTHDQVEAMTLADRIVVLQAGNLIQYDTPDGIYNRPSAKFVAGFTGSPPMNFLPCRVGEGGRMLHLAGGIDLPVPARRVTECARYAGRELTFGLRPEHISARHVGRAREHRVAREGDTGRAAGIGYARPPQAGCGCGRRRDDRTLSARSGPRRRCAADRFARTESLPSVRSRTGAAVRGADR